MPIRQRSHHTAKHHRARTTWWAIPANRQKVAKEAKSLGLTSSEYMRLMLSVSSTLRENVHLDSTLQPRELLKLVENPLFSLVLQWITKNALSAFSKDGLSLSEMEPEAKESVIGETPSTTNPPTALQAPGNLPWPTAPVPSYPPGTVRLVPARPPMVPPAGPYWL